MAAWTDTDLTADPFTAITSGVRSVTFADGRRTEYQSLDHMLAAEKVIAAALQMQTEALSGIFAAAPLLQERPVMGAARYLPRQATNRRLRKSGRQDDPPRRSRRVRCGNARPPRCRLAPHAPGRQRRADARRHGALRGIARDLVRNNPFAARGVSAIANNLVGTGITFQVYRDGKIDEKLNAIARKHFDTNKLRRRWPHGPLRPPAAGGPHDR
jgi:hypothetical protein